MVVVLSPYLLDWDKQLHLTSLAAIIFNLDKVRRCLSKKKKKKTGIALDIFTTIMAML